MISHPDHFHNAPFRHNSATNTSQFYYCAKAEAKFRGLLGTKWLATFDDFVFDWVLDLRVPVMISILADRHFASTAALAALAASS